MKLTRLQKDYLLQLMQYHSTINNYEDIGFEGVVALQFLDKKKEWNTEDLEVAVNNFIETLKPFEEDMDEWTAWQESMKDF